MSKLLGYVDYKDNNTLEEILNNIAYSIDIDKENYKYFDCDALWQEAQDEFFEHGSDTAECRISGLDYIIIDK